MSKALSVAMSPHFRAGQDYERERIIALLEDEASQAEADSTLGLNIQSETIRWCIALIKGENK